MLPAPTVLMTPAAAELHKPEDVIRPGWDEPLDLTVFVSCYNEEPYIVKTIETVHAALADIGRISYEIIVIDDCSGDRGADLVEEYIRTHPEQRILLRRNSVNQGWAQNYLDAAFIGKGKYYRICCGDNSEPKDTMISVFSQIGDVDILVPYYSKNIGRGAFRTGISSAYTTLINIASGFRLQYYNGLAVHLRYNVMRWHSNTRGFGFQADILCMLLEQGFSYKEVPVIAIEQKKGKSTAINFKNLLSVTHTLFDIVVRRIANRMYRVKQKGRG